MRYLGSNARPLAAVFAVATVLAAPGVSTAAADPDGPSRFAILIEGGPTWDSADPQEFFLTDPAAREPLLEFQSGTAVAAAVDVQLTPVLVLRGQIEAGKAEIENVLFGPAASLDNVVVATTRYEGARIGIFLHGLLRRDPFDPASDHRTLGRFGLSIARSRLAGVELEDVARTEFEITSWDTKDALQLALEAEWIGRLGRSPWFLGVGLVIGVGQGPQIVFRPDAGSAYVPSGFEYQPNRMVARIGYRFGVARK